MIDNLFIVSHLGQLAQIEALIDQKNLSNNGLILLYTEMNLSIANTVESYYNSNLFCLFQKVKLPVRPNKIDVGKLLNIKKQYIKILKELKPSNLYVLSFEGHYNLLLSYAKFKEINIYLLEEGTATYKEDSIRNIIGKKEKISRFLIQYTPFFTSLRSSLIRFVDFDKIFGSFPKLLKERFNDTEVEYFFIYNKTKENYINVKKLIKNYNISTNDFIYLNQRYDIDKNEYVSIVIDVLLQFNKNFKGRVFIKMHPKDSIELIDVFGLEIERLGVRNSIILIKESKFLIEPTIAMLKIQGVIGLTSTTLVYAPIVSQRTNVYSIAPILLDRISKSLDNKNGIFLIKEHFKILKCFPHIYFVKNIKDLKGVLL